MANPNKHDSQMADRNGNPMFARTRSAKVADAAAATAVAMPAGGTGAAAGGWDTAANRDQAIAEFAALLADVADIRAQLNSCLDVLEAHGLMADA